MSNIGVIVPAYKEKDNLIRLCEEIIKFVPTVQILIVDDSPDLESVNLIQQRKLPGVEIIHRTQKAGRGSAVLAGLAELSKKNLEYYIEMDADFSHPPSQLPQLIQMAEQKNLDLLIASRYTSSSQILNWPLTRRIFSKLSNLLAKFLLQVPVSDYTNGYRLYSHKAAIEIARSCGGRGTGFIALSEILVCLYYQNYKVDELPTVFTNRVRGESSLSKKEILNALMGLRKIYQYKLSLKR